jgi:hypothetical protein
LLTEEAAPQQFEKTWMQKVSHDREESFFDIFKTCQCHSIVNELSRMIRRTFLNSGNSRSSQQQKKNLKPGAFPSKVRPKEVASLHHIPRKSNTMGCCNSKQKEITRPSVIRKSATLEKNELPLSILLTGGQKLRESNLTGRGVKVAVIDSGVDKDHPGFNGQVKKQVWYRKGTPLEEDDHGTHVAGTVHLMAPQVKNDSNKRCMSIASHALIQKV